MRVSLFFETPHTRREFCRLTVRLPWPWGNGAGCGCGTAYDDGGAGPVLEHADDGRGRSYSGRRRGDYISLVPIPALHGDHGLLPVTRSVAEGTTTVLELGTVTVLFTYVVVVAVTVGVIVWLKMTVGVA